MAPNFCSRKVGAIAKINELRRRGRDIMGMSHRGLTRLLGEHAGTICLGLNHFKGKYSQYQKYQHY